MHYWVRGRGGGGESAGGQNARDQIVFVHSALYSIALAGMNYRAISVTEHDGESRALHIG